MQELQEGLYRGEVAFCKRIKKIEKSLRANRISFDYESSGSFTLYAEVFNSEYYKELFLSYCEEDEVFVLSDGAERELYVAAPSEFSEIISFLLITYSNSFKSGLLLTY